jgi:predicted Zn finger-like uncharacterized protein
VNVTCQDCRSVFRVDPAKVPPNGVRARCSVCGAILRIAVGATTPLTNPALTPRSQTPLRTPVVAATPPTTRQPTPAAPVPMQPPIYAPRPTPSVSNAAMTPAQAFTPAGARPLVPPPPPSPGQLVAAAAASAPTPAATSVVSSVTPIGSDAKRVINPFLRSDPMTRAKRLARALVSDMVAYQPAKRADGLTNGTLKQLFRDEIRKSYDEYVEQVGRDVAESTTFFQDALNQVLADGNRVF